MINRYRKLFNLFAFSVLALAIYLNFFSSDTDQPATRSKATKFQQAATNVKSKSIASTENMSSPLAKEAKKN